MQKFIQENKNTPVVKEVDVLVCGGGPAGLVAAVAAARNGQNVLLLERYGCLGGLATGGFVLLMDCLFDSQGSRWVDGIFWEMMERIKENAGLSWDKPAWINFESELFKIIAEEMCLEAGVTLQYHTWVVDAIVEQGILKGVITESKSGRQAVLSRLCIDASGDGDIAAFAGAGFSMGYMPIGLNMKIAGINMEEFSAFKEDGNQQYNELMLELKRRQGFDFHIHSTAGKHLGIYWINNPGILRKITEDSAKDEQGDLLSAVDVKDLSFVEIELRKRLYDSFRFYQENIPGFKHANLVSFASQIGVRDSRHITGVRTLNEKDVRSQKAMEDSIGMACVSFAGEVETFQVPYGCLIPQDITGLLTAGRCISVDHWISNAVRLIPACMMIGQAAGTAAALSLQKNILPHELSVTALQQKLMEDHVILTRE